MVREEIKEMFSQDHITQPMHNLLNYNLSEKQKQTLETRRTTQYQLQKTPKVHPLFHLAKKASRARRKSLSFAKTALPNIEKLF